MSGFEIAMTVIFSFLALWLCMLCYQVIFYIEKRLLNRYENEKKPASKNEADEEK